MPSRLPAFLRLVVFFAVLIAGASAGGHAGKARDVGVVHQVSRPVIAAGASSQIR